MPIRRPETAVEPSRTLRIPRACEDPTCGAVYYVAVGAVGAVCPVCDAERVDFQLSA